MTKDEFTRLKIGDRVKQGSVIYEVVSTSRFYGEHDVVLKPVDVLHTYTMLVAGSDGESYTRFELIPD